MSTNCKWCKRPLATVGDHDALADDDSGDQFCWKEWTGSSDCEQIKERMKDAAPDLLEALDDLLSYVESTSCGEPGWPREAPEKARAAIARATGKES